MSERAGVPLSERAKNLGAGFLWLLALGAVIALFLFPVSTGVRALVLPLVRTIASGDPVTVALLTLSLYVVPSIVLTVLIALRIRRKPSRAAAWRRAALAALVLFPGLAVAPSGRGSLHNARVYRAITEHMGTTELADAVVHGYTWGAGGLLLWGVLGLVSLYLTEWRRLKHARLLAYVVVTGGGMVTYWAIRVLLIAAGSPPPWAG